MNTAYKLESYFNYFITFEIYFTFMKNFIKYIIFVLPLFVFSQTPKVPELEIKDSLYREDQFYLNITYNLMQNKPSGFAQNGFSGGFSGGFLRDMPINKNRTWSIALGAGYSYNNIKNNIQVIQTNDEIKFDISKDFKKNNLVLHYLEIPLEIRWRTSKPESHIFWRVYSGIKMNYLFASKINFQSSTEAYIIKNNNTLTKISFAPYLAVGYNTINIYASYNLNPLFKNQTLNNNPLEVSSLNLGFQFYIL